VGIHLENVDPVLRHRRDVFVKKIEGADSQCEQRQTLQEFVDGDDAQATAMSSLSGHFPATIVYQEAGSPLLRTVNEAR
jgi:hypothetical protein